MTSPLVSTAEFRAWIPPSTGDPDATRDLVVATTDGIVGGVRGSDLRTWRGVPYGRTTGGKNRFCAPRPASAWRGVRDCSLFGQVAPQTTYSWTDRVRGGEDCLNLDIVRPDNDDTLPVVVYLHGGSYIMGSSHERVLRGYSLVNSMDVVYVSINFRLGALGYLDVRSLGDDCVANPALHDQLLALHWVHENIASFGGDPGNVTLMGESAGAAAVISLMCVQGAQGLFHRAVAQSTPMASVHSPTQSRFWTRELVYRMALSRLSTLEDLRQESAADIVRAGQSMLWRSGGAVELLQLNTPFGPTVDGELLPEHPLKMFEQGRQAQIPLMIGTNSGETSFSKAFYLRNSARRKAALRMLSVFDQETAPEVVKAYEHASNRSDFAELLADALFWAPTVRLAEAHSRYAPTYMYRFDYAPEALERLGLDAIHSFELNAVFGDFESSRAAGLTKFGGGSDSAEALTEVVQDHWAQFIHGGQPGAAWESYDVMEDATQQRGTMVIDTTSRMVYDPKAEKRVAWESYDMFEWGMGRPEFARELERFATEEFWSSAYYGENPPTEAMGARSDMLKGRLLSMFGRESHDAS